MNFVRKNIAAMDGYVPGEQPRDRTYIKLNTNENPYPPTPRVLEALRHFDFTRLRLYPDPVFLKLRETAAKTYGLPGADWVLAGNGSDDLLTIAVRTFVDQGGALAHPDPSYSLYPVLAGLQGATAVAVPLTADFSLPEDAAAQAAGASLFFIARPNAPTANSFPIDQMRKLCAEFRGIVWIDEAYADFAEDNCLALLREFPNVVVSRTFSKSFSLAGARLGLAFARPELLGEMMKVKDSYNVNMLTQLAGTAALEDVEHMRQTAARICITRTQVVGQLQALGCTVCPSEANFLLAKPPRLPAEIVLKELRSRGFLVRWFNLPRVRDYLRITIGTEEEMAGFIAAMKEIVGE